MTDPNVSPHSSINPVKRLLKSFGHSLEGLKAAWASEWAFRVEVVLAVPLLLWVYNMQVGPPKKMLLVGSIALVLIVELLNSAIEAVVDRISVDQHPLSKKAKDIGSSAVLLALLYAGFVWGMVLMGK